MTVSSVSTPPLSVGIECSNAETVSELIKCSRWKPFSHDVCILLLCWYVENT
ncbi:hypothetical protein C2845_PM02G34110 [Panicum miliaceum]|uniref:Uncharacterized protein n=1 Tax=Panicum miliaceum TaxID=4540 RepID=A0A3L6SEI1_PANMI|nr:hypothetical protein C2845_PM02G34110 [Panicum miliaceum]